MINNIEENRISAVGVTFDSGLRLMWTMCIQTNISVEQSNFETIGNGFELPEFHANVLPTFTSICIQNSVHIGGKLKLSLLQNSIIIPIINSLVSCAHFKMFVTQVSKDKHLLNQNLFYNFMILKFGLFSNNIYRVPRLHEPINGPFTDGKNAHGKQIVVIKFFICWLLNSKTQKSKDL